jgi:hypothetical protein
MRALLFLITFLYSQTITATYIAKYGIFGTILKAKGKFIKNDNNYTISTSFKTLSIAKTLSNSLKEKFTSIGIIKNGYLVPSQYIFEVYRGKNYYKRVYIFDHKNKKIIKKRFKNGSLTKAYEYPYKKEDILTLYWNLPKYLKKNLTQFDVIGAKKVDIEILKQDKITTIKANLHNKIFVGDSGILILDINSSNWVALRGILKNVLKIGDLKGKLINFQIKN